MLIHARFEFFRTLRSSGNQHLKRRMQGVFDLSQRGGIGFPGGIIMKNAHHLLMQAG